jgi:hypothetical protein
MATARPIRSMDPYAEQFWAFTQAGPTSLHRRAFETIEPGDVLVIDARGGGIGILRPPAAPVPHPTTA